MQYLERYRDLIDDWNAFSDAVRRPLPTCIWTNTLRTGADRVRNWLMQEGIEIAPLSWLESAFRLPVGINPGNRLPYVAGLYHVQEEVSLVPPIVLAPQPGERILDLCAAPGNKTAQIAVMMQNDGMVVANDLSGGRMNVLKTSVQRLGLTCVLTTSRNAANYTTTSTPFDRVLADVPCSCEGTCRKHPSALRKAGAQQSLAMSRLQRAILNRAIDLCRPGGRIAYSTCTFAPEENEAVVDAVLQTRNVTLLPVEVPGLITSPALTSWEDSHYHATMTRAMRLWPHQNDTGGFFVAVLQKSGS